MSSIRWCRPWDDRREDAGRDPAPIWDIWNMIKAYKSWDKPPRSRLRNLDDGNILIGNSLMVNIMLFGVDFPKKTNPFTCDICLIFVYCVRLCKIVYIHWTCLYILLCVYSPHFPLSNHVSCGFCHSQHLPLASRAKRVALAWKVAAEVTVCHVFLDGSLAPHGEHTGNHTSQNTKHRSSSESRWFVWGIQGKMTERSIGCQVRDIIIWDDDEINWMLTFV